MPKTEDLTGHAFARLDVCFLSYMNDDEHPLKASDGSYNEMFYDEGRTAFAAPICHACWVAKQAREAETPVVSTKKRGRK